MPKAAPGSASPLLREAEASCRFHWGLHGGGNVAGGVPKAYVRSPPFEGVTVPLSIEHQVSSTPTSWSWQRSTAP
jgi:hypothetical protein